VNSVIVSDSEAAAALAAGEVVAIPTDTVYGLAVDPRRPGATELLFEAKGRPDSAALPVLVGDPAAAFELGILAGAAARLVERFWPGALTVVVRRGSAARAFELGGDPGTIGLRCPAHTLAAGLLRRAGPLAVSSANRHGGTPCHSAQEVLAAFGGSVPVLDGGECDGRPSTVVTVGPDGLECLRQGAVAMSDLQHVLASAVHDP
jgi:tRNA threonylcarbamoyl adenosine modification protein (Sua5/YciO/YrdC/YwlC family)